MMQRFVGKKKGGAQVNERRLSTVDEGEEAVEVAKLAAAEAEVLRLDKLIEGVEAKIADVEAEREAWMEDPDAAFNALKPAKQRACKDPDGYWAFLEREKSELRAELAARLNDRGGARGDRGGQKHIVAYVKSRKPTMWRVEGLIRGSKRLSGIRAFVYAMASDEAGRALVDPEAGATLSLPGTGLGRKSLFKECIWYEDDDLHFRVLFASLNAGQRFCNKLSEHRHINAEKNLVVTDPVLLDGSFPTTGIRRIDYDTDDESSPAYSQILSMQVTKADPKEPLTRFQSIEQPELLMLGYDLEKAHLVHDSELKARRKAGRADCKDDVNNNRLVLTSTIHKMFDGHRNGEGYTRLPLVMIEPADSLPESAPDVQVPEELQGVRETRFLVWLRVTAYDEDTTTGIIGRMKGGCFVHANGGCREIYTHVHVLDPDAFRANLEWKAADTRRLWDC
mmetsp:Transcript_12163/g.34397  ORF Transcript_12163/g.34397 Transcript_12163/m.34397 type:complete len:451 (+) Transcript_12163:98-1450(+)